MQSSFTRFTEVPSRYDLKKTAKARAKERRKARRQAKQRRSQYGGLWDE